MDARIIAVLVALAVGCQNVLSQTTSTSTLIPTPTADQLECINNASSSGVLQTLCEEFLQVSSDRVRYFASQLCKYVCAWRECMFRVDMVPWLLGQENTKRTIPIRLQCHASCQPFQGKSVSLQSIRVPMKEGRWRLPPSLSSFPSEGGKGTRRSLKMADGLSGAQRDMHAWLDKIMNSQACYRRKLNM